MPKQLNYLQMARLYGVLDELPGMPQKRHRLDVAPGKRKTLHPSHAIFCLYSSAVASMRAGFETINQGVFFSIHS